jgi:hypothetical protein
MKLKLSSFHRSAMKCLAVLTLACGALAALSAIESGGSAGDAAATSVVVVSLMAIGLAPGIQSARSGLKAGRVLPLRQAKMNARLNLQSGGFIGGNTNANIDRLAFIKGLRAKARVLQPLTARRVDAILAKFEDNLTDSDKAEKAAAKLKELHELAASGDRAAKAELAQLRIITVDNFLIASTNPIAFFDTVSLANNEIPYIENTSRQEIQVSYLGQDGQAKKTQAIRYQQQAQVDLHTLSTEDFEYQLMDIYKGEVKGAMLANIDMTRDFDLKTSALLWPFVFAAIGSFNLTGARAGRVYFPHSIVNTKNLPTTNLLVTPGNTSTSLFRKESMDVILKYCAAWGNVFGDGQMKPVAVYIPSSEVMGFLDSVQMTSFGNSKVEEIFDYGFVVSYGGAKWNFIADATLDPDPGLAYVQFSKPIGSFFTKPGMDKVFEDESIGMQKQNKGSVSMSKVIGFGLPITARVNIAAVQYHTAR